MKKKSVFRRNMKEKKCWKSEKVLFAGCDQIERIRILDHHKNFKIKRCFLKTVSV